MPLERGVSPSYAVDASERDDGVSEGEVTNAVTVQDILVKLDSVKVCVMHAREQYSVSKIDLSSLSYLV